MWVFGSRIGVNMLTVANPLTDLRNVKLMCVSRGHPSHGLYSTRVRDTSRANMASPSNLKP